MIRAKIVGAGGYGGVGITELLSQHPEAEIACLVDVADIGKPMSQLYPHLDGTCDQRIVAGSNPKAQQPVDVVFMATPDGVGMQLAKDELAAGAKVVDYSGDFRFNSEEAYADYAGRIGRDPKHAAAELLRESVYGLAELHRNQIADGCRVVGNPGCFAVSCILGLAPAVKHGLVASQGIICDCKTGVSGAGKKPSPGFHYPARYESMNAYKLAGHQHVCEIERELSLLGGREVTITFTSQVVPICRGIMATLYGRLTPDTRAQDVVSRYADFYADDAFVRVYERDAAVASSHVRGTNYCNLVVDVDDRTGTLRVVSYIDNLMKGQAGSALQNMNILFGLPEAAGLERPGQCP
jgi:N-acetyl-gamma-glutamyl-phosphate reductase